MHSFFRSMLASVVLGQLVFVGCGCKESQQNHTSYKVPRGSGALVTVNFEQGQPLRYRMLSERQTQIDLAGGGEKGKKSAPQTMTEKLELVMVYTPVQVDPFGLTQIKVTCESAKVTRTSFSGRDAGRDAVESLPELSYTLTLTPTGQVDDASEFEAVVRQLGDKAFAQVRPEAGRVKDADMINDFIALQQSMWTAIASMDKPSEGLTVGKSWKTLQLMPWPSPMRPFPTRATTFTVNNIAAADNGSRQAHLATTYALSDKEVGGVPMPYDGPFQMRGMFGFLRNYQFHTIDGGGTQVFDIDAGALIRDEQRYTLQVGADFALPLGDSKPILTVQQTLLIERLL